MTIRTFKAELDFLDEMIEFILSAAKEKADDKRFLNQMRLVAEEALVNVISYAYGDRCGDIGIETVLADDGSLKIEVSDDGIAFNPLEKDEPDLDAPIEERQIGGLGIFMINEIMDDVSYRRENDRNILTLLKK